MLPRVPKVLVFPVDSKQRFEYMKYICAYDSLIKVAKEILSFLFAIQHIPPRLRLCSQSFTLIEHRNGAVG